MSKRLEFRVGTSRRRDTYGYHVVSLRVDGVKVSSTTGGGYDMAGTVLGDFLMWAYGDRVRLLASPLVDMAKANPDGRFYQTGAELPITLANGWTFYASGLVVWRNTTEDAIHVELDGGCGFSAMENIARALGLHLKRISGDHLPSIYELTDDRAA